MLLGMLASAKPQIVADNIDVLLQVGLGPLGKVSEWPREASIGLTD
jgi:hypothetical protein